MPYEGREGGETAADDAAGDFRHAVMGNGDVSAIRVRVAGEGILGNVLVGCQRGMLPDEIEGVVVPRHVQRALDRRIVLCEFHEAECTSYTRADEQAYKRQRMQVLRADGN